MEELELVGVKVTVDWDDPQGLRITAWTYGSAEEAGQIVLDPPSVRRLVEYAQTWLEQHK